MDQFLSSAKLVLLCGLSSPALSTLSSSLDWTESNLDFGAGAVSIDRDLNEKLNQKVGINQLEPELKYQSAVFLTTLPLLIECTTPFTPQKLNCQGPASISQSLLGEVS